MRWLFAPQLTHARLPFLITWLGEARGDQPMENFEGKQVDLWHSTWTSLNFCKNISIWLAAYMTEMFWQWPYVTVNTAVMKTNDFHLFKKKSNCMVKGKTAKLAWFCYIRWIEQLKFISWDIVANTIVVWNGTYRSIMETESKNWQRLHKL